ncbi:hypothetical protein D7030_06395 [Flavobacteriaceae bacterium AU392]|nr:hypothetical protein D1817_02025 [Flavobacteriaceae bacterium]RKM84764.1 hypothetical protein D7030_06395 [Flavobacteriaceae bacterium AU392]
MKQINFVTVKFFLKRKLILLFLVLGFSSITVRANSLENIKISLNLSDVPLSEALREIEITTDYKFLYKNEDLNLNKQISIKVKEQPIEYVLSELLKEEELVFKILKNQIILKKNYLEHYQNHTIQGKVVDKETGEVIPFCSITIGTTYTGTSSNEEGEFIVNVDILPAELIFSHLNYEKQTIVISETLDVVVSMQPLVNNLEAITLPVDNGRYALRLAKEAFNKTTRESNIGKFGKALYRQKSKNGDNYSELSEIIYDIRYSDSGIEDWDILEGRYALKPETVNNKNYTLFSRLLKAIQPNTKDLIFPLHRELERFYDIKIINTFNSGQDEIAVLWFKPLKNITTPIFEGEVSINTKTYDVLKVTGSISRDDLKLVRLTEKSTYKKDYKLSYEIAFKKDTILDLAIDYIKVDQEFDYYKEDSLQTHVSSISNLSFFEYYTPTSRRKLGRQFRRKASDWDNLNEIGYNKKFWEDNPIVKRTPVEQEVIASFEKDNAFGSIFLNSKEQIALLQTNIAGDPFIKELSKNLNEYNNYNPIEKVYLHTDKELFSMSEELWYSAYCTLGANYNYSLASKVLYVSLMNSDNEIVTFQTQELIEGKGKGSITIPENIKPGLYQLIASTNWMRNFDEDFFFRKIVSIVDNEHFNKEEVKTDDKIDLQFFPEGGDLINGLNSLVAFKAIGNDGINKAVKGKVLNAKGDVITFINTIDNTAGTGFFYFTPKIGETYVAELKDGSRYPLPEIKNEGYSLTINNSSSRRSIIVKIQASEQLRNKKFYVIGSIQNKKYYQGRFEFADAAFVNFEIPKNKLPSGVMTLTLFDENGKPWNERALFINNQEELVITAELNKNKFEFRDKIELDINVTDTDGRPVSTNLSLAITDKNKILKNANTSNILTQLLLESEVKGYIESPALYFKDQKRSTRAKLDLIMLTHGWRRFNWRDLENQKFNSAKKHPFTKGLSISGIAKTLNNKPLIATTLKVVAKSKDAFGMYPVKTDENGRFKIDNFNHTDSTKVVFNAYTDKGTPIDIKTILDEQKPDITFSKLSFGNSKTNGDFKHNQDYFESSKLRRETDSLFDLKYDFNKITNLDEVLLEAEATKKSSNAAPSVYGVEPDVTIYSKGKEFTSFIQLLIGVSGINVVGSGRSAAVSIRGAGNPLWVVDGIPIESSGVTAGPALVEGGGGPEGNAQSTGAQLASPSAATATSIPSDLATLSSRDVERIEVLKGASAAIYGLRGGNGVILIYTKRGGVIYDDVLSPEFTIMGYSGGKEFYSPKYDAKKEEHIKPDYRTTLYWNPSIITDKNGKASITFFNSDFTENFQIDIQGLSEYGIPGAYLKAFGKRENN